jgi:outer membrane lipoprotein Slp family protein
MRLMRWTQSLLVLALCVIVGCTVVPRKYVRESVPKLTFSTLAANPQLYHDRLVILGAVIVKEEMRDGDLWLHVKNRPLDEGYRPRLPPTPSDPEAGWYWIIVQNQHTLPDSYHHWADMVIVGRVIGVGPGNEPLLNMVYGRGWGLTSAHDGVWEHVEDMNYIPSRIGAIRGELGQQ